MLAIGICAAPRPGGVSYLPQTLNSLTSQFSGPVHVFGEPGAVFPEPCDKIVQIHTNKRRLGNWRNWQQMATWLLTHTVAPYLMTCEDDILLHPCALEKVARFVPLLPVDSWNFISLYTSGKYRNEGSSTLEGLVSFDRVRVWGACCYLFSRAALGRILDHPLAQTWSGTQPGMEFPDGVDHAVCDITAAIRRRNYRGLNYYCRPSLVQHIGEHSAVNNRGLDAGRTAADFSA